MKPKRKEFREAHNVSLTAVKLPPFPKKIMLVSGESFLLEAFSDVQLKLIGVRWLHQLLEHARTKRLLRAAKGKGK